MPQTISKETNPQWNDDFNTYSQEYINPNYVQNYPNYNVMETNTKHKTNFIPTNIYNYQNENLIKNSSDFSNNKIEMINSSYYSNKNPLNVEMNNNTRETNIKKKEKFLEKLHQHQEIYYSDAELEHKEKIKKEAFQHKSNSKTKMKDYDYEKKQEKIDVSSVESKIKDQIQNDKQNFKEKRKEADEYYKSLGFKNYDDWLNYNDIKNKGDEDKNKIHLGPTIIKKNILISYDKNLQPADVKENLKQVPIAKAKAMKLISEEENKKNLLNNNYTNYNNKIDNNLEKYNSNYTSEKNPLSNNNNYNSNNINYKNDYPNNNNNQNAFNNNNNFPNNSFKNYENANYNSEENNEEAEREMLSSFSPSEKTKSKFK